MAFSVGSGVAVGIAGPWTSWKHTEGLYSWKHKRAVLFLAISFIMGGKEGEGCELEGKQILEA